MAVAGMDTPSGPQKITASPSRYSGAKICSCTRTICFGSATVYSHLSSAGQQWLGTEPLFEVQDGKHCNMHRNMHAAL